MPHKKYTDHQARESIQDRISITERTWTNVRDLRNEIYKERDIISGDAKDQRKQELIKMIFAKVKKFGVLQLERVNLILDDIKN